MVRVYSAPTLAKVAIVQSVLETSGIACEVRNETLGSAFGELPWAECWPEVWVIDDADVERARELIAEATEPGTSAEEPWRCRRCREEVDANLGECWSCGAERPAPRK